MEYDSSEEEEVADTESFRKWSIRPESNEGIIVCVWSERKEHTGIFNNSMSVSEEIEPIVLKRGRTTSNIAS